MQTFASFCRIPDTVHVIAEIGTSHGGSFEKACQLIDAAVQAGADSVKFQWVYADEILHPDTGIVTLPTGRIRLYDRFRELEVSPRFYAQVRAYAASCHIGFICSPFGLRRLRELLEIGPDAVKIASPELNHFPLLSALAEYRKKQIGLYRQTGELPIPVILQEGLLM
jgi:sialic acid synthase SpsE